MPGCRSGLSAGKQGCGGVKAVSGESAVRALDSPETLVRRAPAVARTAPKAECRPSSRTRMDGRGRSAPSYGSKGCSAVAYPGVDPLRAVGDGLVLWGPSPGAEVSALHGSRNGFQDPLAAC